jgi:hypothetical protein
MKGDFSITKGYLELYVGMHYPILKASSMPLHFSPLAIWLK